MFIQTFVNLPIFNLDLEFDIYNGITLKRALYERLRCAGVSMIHYSDTAYGFYVIQFAAQPCFPK